MSGLSLPRHWFEDERNIFVPSEVSLELCADVDARRLSTGVLNNQKQLSDDLYHVAGL